jgi:hypothetical protein
MGFLIFLGFLLCYALIGRLVFAYTYKITNKATYCPDEMPAALCAIFWPAAVIYYLVLKYPFRLSHRLGEQMGNWQLEKATVRLQKQLAIREQLEEANRQAQRELAQAQKELEQELAEDNSSLEQQFKVLEKQQGARIG